MRRGNAKGDETAENEDDPRMPVRVSFWKRVQLKSLSHPSIDNRSKTNYRAASTGGDCRVAGTHLRHTKQKTPPTCLLIKRTTFYECSLIRRENRSLWTCCADASSDFPSIGIKTRFFRGKQLNAARGHRSKK